MQLTELGTPEHAVLRGERPERRCDSEIIDYLKSRILLFPFLRDLRLASHLRVSTFITTNTPREG